MAGNRRKKGLTKAQQIPQDKETTTINSRPIQHIKDIQKTEPQKDQTKRRVQKVPSFRQKMLETYPSVQRSLRFVKKKKKALPNKSPSTLPLLAVRSAEPVSTCENEAAIEASEFCFRGKAKELS